MTKIRYISKRPRQDTLAMIAQANAIIEEYMADGYSLTLRQLYYQFVSRGLIENTTRSYHRLGSIINDGRMAGLIDWEAIIDRTRELEKLPTWDSPSAIIEACANQFRIDIWAGQPARVEVWIEKEALAGVFQRVCEQWRVPFLCCRGYTSQSEMWGGAQRLLNYDGQTLHILHFGDHDPSGIDMTRDIEDRLSTFGADVEIHRIALNMPQIEEYDPPPNPAKMTDSRFGQYQQRFGDESWELDALEPRVLSGLVETEIRELLDAKRWEVSMEIETSMRRQLADCADRWPEVVVALSKKPRK